jgi:hypothetical protein
MSDNPYRNMKNEKCCSQLSTCFKRHGSSEQEDFQAVFRAAGEAETTQENSQDWLELDEGDPGFQLPVFLYFLNMSSIIIFCYLFSSSLSTLLNFQFIFFLSIFVFYG